MTKWLKLSIAIVLGAVAGYAYYYFIGCNTGNCPLTSNWKITTLYGAGIGLVLGFPTKDKKATK